MYTLQWQDNEKMKPYPVLHAWVSFTLVTFQYFKFCSYRNSQNSYGNIFYL